MCSTVAVMRIRALEVVRPVGLVWSFSLAARSSCSPSKRFRAASAASCSPLVLAPSRNASIFDIFSFILVVVMAGSSFDLTFSILLFDRRAGDGTLKLRRLFLRLRHIGQQATDGHDR